jgi:mannitol-1-/sugar-/sorbitol-6-phosphatase
VILSDMDGVLVDSTAAVERTWRWWTTERARDASLYDRIPHGRPARAVIAELAPSLDLDAEAAAMEDRECTDVQGIVALPGAAELLARDDVAIVTSCTRPLLAARLREAGLTAPRVAITADMIERGKPAPDGYLRAARELGADPADCTVLEDAPAGVAAGRAAGARVVGVLTTYGPQDLADAHALVDDVAGFLRGAWRRAPAR